MAYSAPFQDIRLRNLSDPDFDLSRSLKVICDDAIGLSTILSYYCLRVTYGLNLLLYKI